MAREAALDQRLTEELSAGEVDWNAVYDDAMPRLYNYFRYRVGPGADAEDLTATTFERAWSARDRYRRDVSAFTTWLFAIARNVAIDHYRRRRPQLSLASAAAVIDPDTADSLAERRSDHDRLAALLATLGERERELVALKYGAEMTNRAIARATGLGESNVGTILHRTIAALRERW